MRRMLILRSIWGEAADVTGPGSEIKPQGPAKRAAQAGSYSGAGLDHSVDKWPRKEWAHVSNRPPFVRPVGVMPRIEGEGLCVPTPY
jgi:hypothetical protein